MVYCCFANISSVCSISDCPVCRHQSAEQTLWASTGFVTGFPSWSTPLQSCRTNAGRMWKFGIAETNIPWTYIYIYTYIHILCLGLLKSMWDCWKVKTFRSNLVHPKSHRPSKIGIAYTIFWQGIDFGGVNHITRDCVILFKHAIPKKWTMRCNSFLVGGFNPPEKY